MAPTLRPLALRAGHDPRPLLDQRAIFGGLVDDEGFIERLVQALRILDTEGIEAAIDACLSDDLALVA
jgi:fructuronate reductase/mannitol 2-dehydrogenase